MIAVATGRQLHKRKLIALVSALPKFVALRSVLKMHACPATISTCQYDSTGVSTSNKRYAVQQKNAVQANLSPEGWASLNLLILGSPVTPLWPVKPDLPVSKPERVLG